MAENNRAVIKLKEKFAASILDVREFRGEVTVTVAREKVVDICRFLKESLQYNLCTDVTAVDYLGKQEPRFMVVYNLYSIPNKDRLRLKAGVPDADCSIDTVSCVWNSANWLEREVYDLMGVQFNNHPDLRRILMTDDWVGHPLRKDYPLQGPDREPYKGRLS
ncbi:NADH-quinone oxidoreductase subunit C [Geobacter sulfurreducens]|uniref:NADH-quinone oxidoreductase subunit C n=1 Tax=Geobacter sulfurreducens (strain ATCC 51573 / DSM 12127 / PCA) TaxID=243231 RepID=NUOC_GEOSL|nr:NADH-quinone oxidoreductase subunit C [Geobacter sulfurreducens]Q74GA6.1 RecName: Full=NADH-quinone oxidoreductase subunit C; AltName: Full=NADH dehydrogenase I subunit C; AltName: Full=NDH-1 subunit C [Geobacter sulfurreducens PCA]AAR33673.1 NADH dehydrogenase I, C subunit [Geobacter sulfurreducens PCA]ADI83171.1 NADH dehydrogenase I, C subunit [Geobacter sulfurreducens KN400]AJY70065.1 NADH-quinone oxidoreductase subunit C [Geobacter sulfurreducens]QVW35600.1 NADH-quinone oxidoreductase s